MLQNPLQLLQSNSFRWLTSFFQIQNPTITLSFLSITFSDIVLLLYLLWVLYSPATHHQSHCHYLIFSVVPKLLSIYHIPPDEPSTFWISIIKFRHPLNSIFYGVLILWHFHLLLIALNFILTREISLVKIKRVYFSMYG